MKTGAEYRNVIDTERCMKKNTVNVNITEYQKVTHNSNPNVLLTITSLKVTSVI
jgi:hypothetical protein